MPRASSMGGGGRGTGRRQSHSRRAVAAAVQGAHAQPRGALARPHQRPHALHRGAPCPCAHGGSQPVEEACCCWALECPAPCASQHRRALAGLPLEGTLSDGPTGGLLQGTSPSGDGRLDVDPSTHSAILQWDVTIVGRQCEVAWEVRQRAQSVRSHAAVQAGGAPGFGMVCGTRPDGPLVATHPASALRAKSRQCCP
jgi:hypothetical protein